MGSRCCVGTKLESISENTIVLMNQANPSFFEFLESMTFVPPFIQCFLSNEFYSKLLKGIPFDSIARSCSLNDDEYIVGIKFLLRSTQKSSIFSNEGMKPMRVSEIFHIFKNIQVIIQNYLKVSESTKTKFNIKGLQIKYNSL